MTRSYQKITGYLPNPIIHSLIIFLFFFLLYVTTAPRTNAGYADSDLLVTIGYQLGVAHPPGYPLYIILVYLFTHLPIPGTIAFRAHTLSALLQSTSLSFVFLACHQLISYLQPESVTKPAPRTHLQSSRFNTLIAYAATLSLGTSFLYWLYGSVAEKYPLNNLFISIFIYTIIRMIVGKNSYLPWLILAATTGLALNHHHSFLMLIPTILLFFLFNLHQFKAYWKPTLLAFLLSLTAPIIILLLLNTHHTPISWHFEPTLNGLFRELTRRDFTGYLLIQGRYRGIYFNPIDLNDILTKIPVYLHNLVDHFGMISIVISSIGFFFITKQTLIFITQSPSHFRKHPHYHDSNHGNNMLYSLLFILVLCTTIFIPLYVDWPNDLSTQSLRIRMYLTGYVVIPLLITIGLCHLSNWLFIFLKKKSSALLYFNFLLLLILIGSLIIKLPQTYRQVNLRNFNFVSRHYTSILEELPPNSLLTCLSDTSCFALIYTQQIDKIRPDIIILPHGKPILRDYLAQFNNLHGFDYPDNPQQFLDYLTWNLDKRPVYIIELQKLYHDLLGLNYGFLYYIPHGYYGQLVVEPTTQLPSTDYSFSQKLIDANIPRSDHTRLQLKASLAQKHFLNAITYKHLFAQPGLIQKQSRDRNYNNQLQRLIDLELDLAQQLVADLPPVYRQEVDQVRQLIKQIDGFDLYVPNTPNPTPNQILSQAQIYQNQNQPLLAAIGYTHLLFLNPMNHPVRFQLAQLYLKSGNTQSATQELHNILKYDPANSSAQTIFSSLNQDRSQD